jgi:putative transposase
VQNGVPMAMGRPKAALVLRPQQREQLESLGSSRSLPAGLVRRARIILLGVSRKTNMQIARQMGLNNKTVCQRKVEMSGFLPY